MNKKNLAYAFLVVIFLAVGVLSFSYHNDERMAAPTSFSEIAPTPEFLKSEQARWATRMDAVGPQAAYAEFVAAYDDVENPTLPHSVAHVFGDELYKRTGPSGIAICDRNFGYGCSHSFFGRAIAEEGIESIYELDQACVDAYGPKGLGCMHGIGHGLLGHLGTDALEEALELCGTLSWKGPFGGCASGVLMEYNFRSMDGPEASFRVPEADEALHYPCTVVDSRFQATCYFEQAAWWRALYEEYYHTTQEGAFERVGILCADVADDTARRACFWGAGYVATALIGYDTQKTQDLCALMPAKYRGECLAGAAWLLYAQPEYRERWDSVCAGVTREVEAVCRTGKDLI